MEVVFTLLLVYCSLDVLVEESFNIVYLVLSCSISNSVVIAKTFLSCDHMIWKELRL